jgi:hypothetical protein
MVPSRTFYVKTYEEGNKIEAEGNENKNDHFYKYQKKFLLSSYLRKLEIHPA